MNERLKFTLKAWPVITLVTVGLCVLTGAAAKTFLGIDLEDQTSIDQARAVLLWFARRISDGAGWNMAFFKDVGRFLWFLAFLVALVPAAEELIFRWGLWSLPRPARPVVSAVTSSALFSAAHYISMPWPNNAFIALFFFGLAQCWLYRRTGALWCAMLNHGLFNATNIVLILVFKT
jgi:membrane protease YdiL (CAAX protease family)